MIGESNLKILHIINNLNSGGAQKLIEESLLILNNIEGVHAEVLQLTAKGNVFDKKLKDKGVKITTLPLKNIRNPLNIYYIRKYILKGEYDIVHAHLFPTQYWTAIAFKFIFKHKAKLIFTEHNTHNRRREKPLFRYIERSIYSSYKKVISISEKTQENLIKWLNFKKNCTDKFVVIPNGVNLERFQSAKAYHKAEIHHNFTEDTRLLCMVGRFDKQKDQPTIIRAMEDLSEDTHLLLIGEGPLQEQNKSLAKKLAVDNRVHFLGFRDDVERIFKTADIIILSSHWEGFGLVAVEGMAAGKPVIASDVDGLREVVEGAGLLFAKGDSKELGKIIEALFKDKRQYEKIVQACTERAGHFSIEKMLAAYMKEYEIEYQQKVRK